MTHLKMLKMAASIAQKSRDKYHQGGQEFHLGAVGVRKDGATVHAHNSYRRGALSPLSHAEYRILSRLGRGETLYVARVLHDDSWGMARPCSGCMEAMKNRGVKKVIYTIGPDEYGTLVL